MEESQVRTLTPQVIAVHSAAGSAGLADPPSSAPEFRRTDYPGGIVVGVEATGGRSFRSRQPFDGRMQRTL